MVPYSSSIDDQVAQVVETMWLEAVGAIKEKISTPIPHLKLSEVSLRKICYSLMASALRYVRSILVQLQLISNIVAQYVSLR